MYCGFAIVNFTQMQSQLALLNAANIDIHQVSINGDTYELIQKMADEHMAGRHKFSSSIVKVSHSLMFVLVVLSIIFDQALTKDKPKMNRIDIAAHRVVMSISKAQFGQGKSIDTSTYSPSHASRFLCDRLWVAGQTKH